VGGVFAKARTSNRSHRCSSLVQFPPPVVAVPARDMDSLSKLFVTSPPKEDAAN